MKYALIKDGVVTNVVISAEDWIPDYGMTAMQLTDDQRVGPGWTYDGSSFAPPTPVVPNEWDPEDFLTLLTYDELLAIQRSTEDVALIAQRSIYGRARPVWLDSPLLLETLMGLVAVGLLTLERVDQILAGEAP